MSSSTDWSIEKGERIKRSDIHNQYGGNRQQGIVTNRDWDKVILFSSLEAGAAYGYHTHEGFHEDGSYYYTGAGSIGDQVMDSRSGNLPLRLATSEGKAIHLFVKKKGEEEHRYVGEFQNGVPAYTYEEAPDSTGGRRSVLLFKLDPVDIDESVVHDRDAVDGGKSGVEEYDYKELSTDDVKLPANPGGVAESDRAQDERVAQRKEFELQNEFARWLRAKGHTVKGANLWGPGHKLNPDLRVDFRDGDRGPYVVEVKRSTGREFVRMAIGQVLDYVNMAKGFDHVWRPMILLPSKPDRDLVDLVDGLGISLAYRSEEGFSFNWA